MCYVSVWESMCVGETCVEVFYVWERDLLPLSGGFEEAITYLVVVWQWW